MVIRELCRLVDAGVQRFFLVDNTFNLPPSYARELCERVAAADLNIKWRCIIYPMEVDEVLVEAMAQAGCWEVSVGFESGSERILRNMNKRFGLEEVRQACDMLADHGIRRMGFLLLGGPGETKRTVEESFAFVDSLNLDCVRVTVGIRIYPNTDLARIAVDEGYVSRDDDLLHPKFYFTRELDQWLSETVRTWVDERPNWFM